MWKFYGGNKSVSLLMLLCYNYKGSYGWMLNGQLETKSMKIAKIEKSIFLRHSVITLQVWMVSKAICFGLFGVVIVVCIRFRLLQ